MYRSIQDNPAKSEDIMQISVESTAGIAWKLMKALRDYHLTVVTIDGDIVRGILVAVRSTELGHDVAIIPDKGSSLYDTKLTIKNGRIWISLREIAAVTMP